jgi:hypothetical protein
VLHTGLHAAAIAVVVWWAVDLRTQPSSLAAQRHSLWQHRQLTPRACCAVAMLSLCCAVLPPPCCRRGDGPRKDYEERTGVVQMQAV